MLNEKDTYLDDLDYLLEPCLKNVNLIRLAVDPKNFNRALRLAIAIKDKGFDVAFNLMYMSSWGNDKRFLKNLQQAKGIVDFLYLVDSYGSVTGEDVKSVIKYVRNAVSIPLGFHGHNNLELAFANSLIAIESGCKIVDSTILGMGRGAGNLKTELLLTYISSKFGHSVSYNELGSLVNNVYGVSEFGNLLKKHNWGTNLAYMVSGANSLPQKNVMDWISSRAYSINSILQALQANEKNNKNFPLFSEKSVSNSKAIIIGGGSNASSHAQGVNKLINQFKKCFLIHASAKNAKLYQEFKGQQYYCLVGNEGYRIEEVFHDQKSIKGKCVLPPSPRKMGTYVPNAFEKRVVELEKIDFTDKYTDSHFAIALQIALELKVSKIYLVGFDGYGDQASVGKKELKLTKENQYIIDQLEYLDASIISITPTNYSNINEKSLYQILD